MAISNTLASNTIAKKVWKLTVPKRIRRKIYHARRGKPDSLVTIVVPVYNVEEYLDECITSLVKQSYRDLEIILVNDGSTDNSGSMCDAWAKNDRRISVVHQDNAGLSAARNTGLALATGKYIIFADSDDTVPHDAIRMLATELSQSGSDVATGNVMRFKGETRWPGWNQSYSHRPDLYPERNPGGTVHATSLEAHPELLFDTTAWNKLFRRDFLRRELISFPVGKLYEDMLPIALAYTKARGIDVIFDIVYNYRVREDNSSITQKRSELKNLADKMEMVDRIYDRIANHHGSRALLRTIEFKVFEGDLPVYAPYLGRDDKFDEIYYSTLRKYWDLADLETLNQLPLPKRARLYWEYRRKPDIGAKAERWVSENFFSIPVRTLNGSPIADLSECPKSIAVLADAGLDGMSRYVELRSAVTEAYIDGGVLVVEGYAFLDGVPNNAVDQLSMELVGPEDSSVPITFAPSVSDWANNGWWNLAADRRNSGFVIRLALSDYISNRDGTQPDFTDGDRWFINVTARTSSITKTAALDHVWRGGRIRLGGTARINSDRVAYLDWSNWRDPLTIRTRAARDSVVAVSPYGDTLEVTISVPEMTTKAFLLNDFKLGMKRSWDGTDIYGTLKSLESGLATFKFDLSHISKREEAGGHLNGWKVLSHRKAQGWTPIPLHESANDGIDRTHGWDLRTDTDGNVLIVDPANALLVDNIAVNCGVWVLQGPAHQSLEPDANLTMWSPNGSHMRVAIEQDSDRFSVTIDPTEHGDMGQRVSWPTGEYYFWLHSGSGDSKLRIRASRALVESSLPHNDWSKLNHSRLHLAADNLNISFRVGTPTTHEERGRFHSHRMRTEWSVLPTEQSRPRNAVLFSSFMSRNASDSALEIFKFLRDKHPDIELHWATEDGSVPIPAGAQRLVKRTARWFELLATARIHVNNVGHIDGYGAKPFQAFIQTWHGTPYKLVGKSELDHDGFFHYAGYDRLASEASKWDLFVAQNPFMESIARSDFLYKGPILRAGYPRNDPIVGVCEDQQRQIREKFGIPSGHRVILYAPTWRETAGAGSSRRLVEHLDLQTLSDVLDGDVTFLLRGHNYNAAYTRKKNNSPNVIDVTHYSDLNDLINCSDALISDYSSIAFDYLATDKPVIHFAPDLDEFVKRRGMYGSYSDFTWGPVCLSSSDLVRAINDLDNWERSYGEGRTKMKQRFVPWDDGAATERVVDAMLALSNERLRSNGF